MPRKHDPKYGCSQRTLAANDVARIQQCDDCATVSVHVGAISLRFHAAALESLWNVLGQALLELHQDAQRDVPPLSTLGRPGEA
jgi:hypothetical protein